LCFIFEYRGCHAFFERPGGNNFEPGGQKLIRKRKKRTQKNRERAVGKKLRGSSFLQRRPGASREPSQKAASRSFQKVVFCFEAAFLGNRSQTFGAPQLVGRFQMFNALVRSLHMPSK
jgi:hypothetical protein